MLARFTGILMAVAWLVGSATAQADGPKRLLMDRAHSRLEFVAFTHLYEVKGTFQDYEIYVDGDLDDPAHAKVRVRVHATSVMTHFNAQDSALRSKDFLHAHKHPWIEFVSTRVTEEAGAIVLEGNLSIRGKTRPAQVKLRVSKGADLKGRPTHSYRGGLTIKRSDFGIGSGKMIEELALQDEIELRLMIVAPANKHAS